MSSEYLGGSGVVTRQGRSIREKGQAQTKIRLEPRVVPSSCRRLGPLVAPDGDDARRISETICGQGRTRKKNVSKRQAHRVRTYSEAVRFYLPRLGAGILFQNHCPKIHAKHVMAMTAEGVAPHSHHAHVSSWTRVSVAHGLNHCLPKQLLPRLDTGALWEKALDEPKRMLHPSEKASPAMLRRFH
jgi:hypothetical protein